MAILARLNTNGQGISGAGMNAALGIRLDAEKLKGALTKESKVAVTFPGGTHDLWMRYWLAAAGINPETDLKTIMVPPPEMVANLKRGAMEAFCVGEPWNAQLVNQRAGFTAATTGELWKNHPEKALAVRADWVERHPRAAVSLTAAVIEAQHWCDEAANKEELCSIVSRDAWFGVPVADILPRLRGEVDYGDGRKASNPDTAMKFWRDHASYPFRSHDLWFLTENVRWGMLPQNADLKAMVEQVNREKVWRAAAERAGVKETETPQGTSRGTETFFDGKKFDPENPAAYLASQPIKKLAS
jgi:nitrate/nitrite transport system substrate-binding protein